MNYYPKIVEISKKIMKTYNRRINQNNRELIK